jgi:2-iminobutanoate/2-iminopropanoate deaminase
VSRLQNLEAAKARRNGGLFVSEAIMLARSGKFSREEFMPARLGFLGSLIIATLTFAAASAPALAKECYAPDALSVSRSFSRAVTTEGGKIVWLGGQTGSPDKNFEGQVRDIFASLDGTIKAVGGSGLKDMVQMTVFLTDVRYGDQLTQIRKDIFKDCFPGSALITVTGLARPGLLLEIQGMAVVGGQ